MRNKKADRSLCGIREENLTKDEIGINQNLLGEDIQNFYCLPYLAVCLEATSEEILKKLGSSRRQDVNCLIKGREEAGMVYGDNAATKD